MKKFNRLTADGYDETDSIPNKLGFDVRHYCSDHVWQDSLRRLWKNHQDVDFWNDTLRILEQELLHDV